MSKARNLARLIVDSSGDVDQSSLGNVPPSDDASALTTGTLPAARIADGSLALAKLSTTGSAGSSTFLRGDGSWQSPAGGVTSLNGQTGAITNTDFDSIGSYAVAVRAVSAPVNTGSTNNSNIGGTIAGSSLRYGFLTTSSSAMNSVTDFGSYGRYDANAYALGGTALTGTWRCVSRAAETKVASSDFRWFAGLWVRVS